MDLCAYQNVVRVSAADGDLWFGRIDRDSDVAELAARIADWHRGRYEKLAGPRLVTGEGEALARACAALPGAVSGCALRARRKKGPAGK